ncbi:MAG: ergothioneine biosynthesis protein EgtB [Alphaproteobacteria bacterium]|nr:ergothioneine biosynthesis protein EgtB [Alphaproteobacteria bacterium]
MTYPAKRPIGAPGRALCERFHRVRADTEKLVAPLSAEDQNLQSMPDASPAKWHRAHTTWFFETFLLKQESGYREFDPGYCYLFNSYYEAVGARHPRPARGLLSRPSAEEVACYRRHVDAAMEELLAHRGEEIGIASLVELGIQHEQQHQELLLTDILHAFAQNPLCPAYHETEPAGPRAPVPLEFIRFEGGEAEIGHDGEGFGFDNEGPRHRVLLRPFAIANRAVTNGEWLQFMEAGGYREPRLWLSDGWTACRAAGWDAPLYWQMQDGTWQQMSLAGLKPLDLAAPVAHISYYEADAFARWCGKRLPTEFEWEHAGRHCGHTANLRDPAYLRPRAARGGKGVLAQMYGDVWEWTASPYSPYPGFRASDDAVGEYNGKFMINQMVLRGGSCVTPADHIRASYRNFFYPQQRWQFSGLRLAEDAPRFGARAGGAVVRYSGFLRDVWSGLARPQKQIPSKYFYDAEGARLFDAICELPEYYPTRTDIALLGGLAGELAQMTAPDTALVEFGSGASVKTRILLDAIPAIRTYVPIDILTDYVEQAERSFREAYPALEIAPIVADFLQPVALPTALDHRPLLGFFPGSTIGNLEEADARRFLERARATLGPKGRLLIGIDLVKDAETLIRAYDDAAGVTAAFNRNLLARINTELHGDFDPERFAHRALWNGEQSRIEMHLVSRAEQTVTVSGRAFHFAAGETIHTENSHKYEVARFAEMAAEAGWTLLHRWVSDNPRFAVLLLE